MKSIKKIFDDFRKRGESEDGVPIALLESTHLYSVQNSFPTNIVSSFSSTNPRSYPFFSFDIFTCHTRDNHEKLSDTLYKAYSAADLESLPEFKGLHILGSTDLLVCIGMGIWGSVEDYHKMLANSNTRSELANTKKLAAEGTISDLVAKRPSQRLYYVVDVFKP